MVSNDNWVQTGPWADYFNVLFHWAIALKLGGTESRNHYLEWSNRFIILQASTPRVAKIQNASWRSYGHPDANDNLFKGEAGSHPGTRWCHPLHLLPPARDECFPQLDTSCGLAEREQQASQTLCGYKEETALMPLIQSWRWENPKEHTMGIPWGPVVKTHTSSAAGLGSIP